MGYGRQTIFRISLLVILLSLNYSAKAVEPGTRKNVNAQSIFRGLPSSFELNRGQAEERYRFLVRNSASTLSFATDEMRINLPGRSSNNNSLTIRFEGATPDVVIAGEGPAAGKANYLRGSDPSKWIVGVPTFHALRYASLYQGIDLVFYGDTSQFEHDFLVSPGANPASIRMRVEGASKLSVQPSGELVIETANGAVRFRKPVAYQRENDAREEVAVRFVLRGDELSFSIPSYDHSRTLVIDPVLDFSTYLNDGPSNVAAVATDADGASYLTGLTFGTYPVTPGALQPTCASCPNTPDVYITKLNPDGTALIYSTYLGGSDYDQPFSIAVDKSGNAIVVGRTSSSDFPLKNPLTSLPIPTNGTAAFVTSLNADGTALNYSSLMGTSAGPDQNALASAVAVDSTGNAYVTGIADGNSFPVTPGALNVTPYDFFFSVFASKFTPAGALAYSAIVGNADPQNGGGGLIGPWSIALDSAGNAYIYGTAGTLWPTTAGAFQTAIPGPSPYDAPFVTKINSTASAMVYSTFIAGNSGGGGELTASIAVDSAGNAVIAGACPDSTFPVTADALIKTPPSFNCTGFLTKLNATGSALIYSSFLSSGDLYPSALTLDPKGNIWVAGYTADPQFTLVHPIKSGFAGSPGFLMEFSSSGKSLNFSTYFGSDTAGAHIQSIAADPAGNIHLYGSAPADLYTTPDAYLSTVTPPPPNYDYAYGFAALIDPSKDSSSLCIASSQNQGLYFQSLIGTPSSQTVDITNCGTAPLTISAIDATDPSFTIASSTNTCTGSIAVSASCHVGVQFLPTSTTIVNARLTFSTNATIPQSSLALQGQGTAPAIQLNLPGPFDPALVGTSTKPTYVVLQNIGTADLHIDLAKTNIQGDFTFTPTACDVPVPPTAGCYFLVTFTPTAAGRRDGLLQVVSDDPSNPVVNVPLTGTGLSSYPAPLITGLDPPSVLMGGPSLTLQVYGFNLFPSSVVKVNGVAQTTTYESSGAVHITLDASLLTTSGDLSVTVSNPTPGGGDSQALPLLIFQSIPLTGNKLIFEPKSAKLFAAIPASATDNPNTVISLDPATGKLGSPIAVGKNPWRMATSDDGAYLYVGNVDDFTVQRINLSTNKVEKTYNLPVDSLFGSTYAQEIHVLPGKPKEFIVLTFRGASPGEDGIAYYNDAGLVTWLSNSFDDGYVSVDSAVFMDASTIVGVGGGAGFYTFTIDAGGLHNNGQSQWSGGTTGYGQLVADGKLIYTTNGQVWDFSSRSLVGSYGQDFGFATSVIPDASIGRTFFLGDHNVCSAVESVSSYDQKTFNNLSNECFGGPDVGYGVDLARWGTDGFAFGSPTSGSTIYGFDHVILFHSSSLTSPASGKNPVPVLQAIYPPSLQVGTYDVGIGVGGLNFEPQSVIQWNGTALPTNYYGPNSLQATIPAASLGSPTTASITVFTPAPGGGTSSTLSLSVAGPPAASLSATSLDLGSVLLGSSSSPQTITITNSGTGPLNLYGITASDEFTQTNDCPTPIPASASCHLSVVFAPTAVGARTGSLQLVNDAPDSPQIIALKGSGTDFTVQAGSSGNTSASVSAGATASFLLSLTSSGYAGTVNFACTNAPTYATCSVSPASGTLASNASVPVTVTVTTASNAVSGLASPSAVFVTGGTLFAAFGLLPFALRIKKSRSKLLTVGFLGTLLCGIALFTACGGGGGTSTPPPTTHTVAPGTYQLTLQATSGGKTVNTTLTLTVK